MRPFLTVNDGFTHLIMIVSNRQTCLYRHKLITMKRHINTTVTIPPNNTEVLLLKTDL